MEEIKESKKPQAGDSTEIQEPIKPYKNYPVCSFCLGKDSPDHYCLYKAAHDKHHNKQITICKRCGWKKFQGHKCHEPLANQKFTVIKEGTTDEIAYPAISIPKCDNCLKKGHSTKECLKEDKEQGKEVSSQASLVNEGGKNQEKPGNKRNRDESPELPKRCYYCNRSQHLSEDCPSRSPAERIHSARDRRVRVKLNKSEEAYIKDLPCYACGMKGCFYKELNEDEASKHRIKYYLSCDRCSQRSEFQLAQWSEEDADHEIQAYEPPQPDRKIIRQWKPAANTKHQEKLKKMPEQIVPGYSPTGARSKIPSMMRSSEDPSSSSKSGGSSPVLFYKAVDEMKKDVLERERQAQENDWTWRQQEESEFEEAWAKANEVRRESTSSTEASSRENPPVIHKVKTAQDLSRVLQKHKEKQQNKEKNQKSQEGFHHKGSVDTFGRDLPEPQRPTESGNPIRFPDRKEMPKVPRVSTTTKKTDTEAINQALKRPDNQRKFERDRRPRLTSWEISMQNMAIQGTQRSMKKLMRDGTIKRMRTTRSNLDYDEVPQFDTVIVDTSNTFTNANIMEFYSDMSYASLQDDTAQIPKYKVDKYSRGTLVINAEGFNPGSQDDYARLQGLKLSILLDTIIHYCQVNFSEKSFYFIAGTEQARLPGQTAVQMFENLYLWIKATFRRFKGRLVWIGTGLNGHKTMMVKNHEKLQKYFEEKTSHEFYMKDWWSNIPRHWLKNDGSGKLRFQWTIHIQKVMMAKMKDGNTEPPNWYQDLSTGEKKKSPRKQARTQQWLDRQTRQASLTSKRFVADKDIEMDILNHKMVPAHKVTEHKAMEIKRSLGIQEIRKRPAKNQRPKTKQNNNGYPRAHASGMRDYEAYLVWQQERQQATSKSPSTSTTSEAFLLAELPHGKHIFIPH